MNDNHHIQCKSWYFDFQTGKPYPCNCTPKRDDCSRCHGTRGGVKGNENVVNGVLLCDYCSADDLRASLGASEQ